MLFFFLQAEDGIRDFGVIGVQSCALRIYGQSKPGGVEPPLISPEKSGAAPARQAGIDHRASGAARAEIAGVFDGENFGEPASCACHPPLMVPTAHPQIWAARPAIMAVHLTPGFIVTTNMVTPSTPP